MSYMPHRDSEPERKPLTAKHFLAEIVSSETMIEAESKQLRRRREHLGFEQATPGKQDWFGIACSGGGIRSATFNLGILQALAHKGLLPYVDYLSTVSGGGYIGTWLHGVIRNLGKGNPKEAAPYLDPPELKPHDEKNPARDPVAFLRKYSSYLAPSLGLFSADSWVILVIWFRNMLLNQLIFVPFLGALSLLAFFFGSACLAGGSTVTTAIGLLLAVVALTAGTIVAAKGVRAVAARSHSSLDSTAGAVTCAAALLISSAPIAFLNGVIIGAGNQWTSLLTVFVILWSLFAILQRIGGFVTCSGRLHPQWSIRRIYGTIAFQSFVAAFATSVLIFLLCKWLTTWYVPNEGSWRVIAWGPPLIAMAWMTGETIHVGLMGANYEDFAREWLARVGAFVDILALAWVLWFTLAVFGPYWISLLILNFGKTATGLGGAWLLTTITGILSAKSDRSSGMQNDRQGVSPLEWIAKIAPTVFLTGILVLISFAAFTGIRAIVGAMDPRACTVVQTKPSNPGLIVQFSAQSPGPTDLSLNMSTRAGARVPEGLEWLARIKDDYWCVLGSANAGRAILATAGLLLICGLIAWGMQYTVNINEFSMHHFYKNRLVRCYLGASREEKRKPSRLTGFDPSDDFPIRKLLADPTQLAGSQSFPGEGYYGPFAIVNGTVNLNRGSELARQERQGESFIFTPLHCGFDPPHSDEDRRWVTNSKADLNEHGYRETFRYASPEGLDIGTCMGISGAAANPNHGYHTSATVAFLLTIFDVRLGWWLGNPRRKKGSNEPGPTHALWPLLSELFSQTDQRAHWVNISDGGHFENLGLYELVRRRCKYIIVGDGEQDGGYTFGSLGGAIRKCRTDFGVSIDIDPKRIRPKDESSRTHCVVGAINYPDGESGWLLYLKSSLTGDEPEDVEQYAASNPDFPHETTANQFFTESQFESYRKLGWHITQTAFENVNTGGRHETKSISHIFQCLRQQWYPPSEEAKGAASHHAEAYMALIKRLDADSLKELGPQVFNWGITTQRANVEDYKISSDADQQIFLYCLQLIQLMENVWFDLHFDRALERDGPRHSGWISIFARWTQQPAIQWTWKYSRGTFNPLFQQFFETLAKSGNRYGAPSSVCGDLPSKHDRGGETV